MRIPGFSRGAIYTAAALAATACLPAGAEQRPLWELGLGPSMLAFNDYRGSDTTHVYPLPLVYFVYRGTFLKSDHNGLRGLFLSQDRVELDLSVNATTPVRNDSARQGMPDLRPTLEIGPQLTVHLLHSADQRLKLDLRVPVRAAFTIEASPHMIGVFSAPHVSLDVAQYGGDDGWKLGMLAGPLFADHRYDDYFYSVAPQYATAGRPAFKASGGYAGTQALIALTRRYPAFWIGAYVRHDSLAGASFVDSPLVRRASYWSAGLGIAWIIRKSSRLAESED